MMTYVCTYVSMNIVRIYCAYRAMHSGSLCQLEEIIPSVRVCVFVCQYVCILTCTCFGFECTFVLVHA